MREAAVRGVRDGAQLGDAGEIDDPAGLEDPVLELRQEIGTARHDAGIRPALLQDLEAFVDTSGHSKLESSHAWSPDRRI